MEGGDDAEDDLSQESISRKVILFMKLRNNNRKHTNTRDCAVNLSSFLYF